MHASRRLLLVVLATACAGSSGGEDSDSDSSGPPTLTGDTSCPEAMLFPELEPHAGNSAYDDPWVVAACEDDTLFVAANGIPNWNGTWTD
jgi:hypothetical protein